MDTTTPHVGSRDDVKVTLYAGSYDNSGRPITLADARRIVQVGDLEIYSKSLGRRVTVEDYTRWAGLVADPHVWFLFTTEIIGSPAYRPVLDSGRERLLMILHLLQIDALQVLAVPEVKRSLGIGRRTPGRAANLDPPLHLELGWIGRK